MEALTACVFGAIPPFSFHPALRLVADPLLFERFPQIAFNAGRLDRSIILDTEDYLHLSLIHISPPRAIFSATAPPPRRIADEPVAMM